MSWRLSDLSAAAGGGGGGGEASPPTTLVEQTVSLDVAHFADSFLTCGACLQHYDSRARRAKLLPCSHSVCLACAHSLLDAGASTARCPACARVFAAPSAGGAAALPPSFLVNQLLDVVVQTVSSARPRRGVLARCARHVTCELSFCETCDVVFCAQCADDESGGAGRGHGGSQRSSSVGVTSRSAAHTVVPFSVAVRRVAEIVRYKAAAAAAQLDAAAAAVSAEMLQVDVQSERCVDSVRGVFSELAGALADRRRAVTDSLHRHCLDKTRVLDEQLELIAAERRRVNAQCDNLPTDRRAISTRIAALNELLDTTWCLAEPRENAHVAFTPAPRHHLDAAIVRFGHVRTSDTCPTQCRLHFDQHHLDGQTRARAVLGNDTTVPIQLAQCRFPRLAISNAKHTHTHPFNGPLSGTTRVSRFQKGKTNLDFTEARDSEWQWHQLGRMQVCT